MLECQVSHTHIHTHTHTQPFYGCLDFVQDNPGEPVPEETIHPLTPIVVINHPYLLHPSNATHGILPVYLTTVIYC